MHEIKLVSIFYFCYLSIMMDDGVPASYFVLRGCCKDYQGFVVWVFAGHVYFLCNMGLIKKGECTWVCRSGILYVMTLSYGHWGELLLYCLLNFSKDEYYFDLKKKKNYWVFFFFLENSESFSNPLITTFDERVNFCYRFEIP